MRQGLGGSGGPLMDGNGEVIGSTVAIAGGGEAAGGGNGSVGLGFAIPIDEVRELPPGLRSGTGAG